MRRWGLIGVIVAILVPDAMIVDAAPAKSDAPQIRNVTVGFTSQARNRFWSPMTVDIENPGPAREAFLVGESVGHQSKQAISFSRPVWLPARSRRRVEFPVFVDLNLAQQRKGLDVRAFMSVKLGDGRLQTWHELDALAIPFPEDNVTLLVCDRNAISYNFLREATVGTDRRPATRLVSNPRAMPARTLEYSGVDVLVSGGVTERDLSELQARAIREWLEAGGLMIFVPATDEAALANLPVRPWGLPVAYTDAQRVSFVPELERWGARLEPEAGLLMFRMVSDGGEVLMGDAAIPIAVMHRVGLGKVICLGIPASERSFQSWPGAAGFFRELLEQRSPFFAHADRILERVGRSEDLLSNLAGVKVLGRDRIVLYLLLVAGGIVVLLVAGRFMKSPEWSWVAAVALALVAGAGAVASAMRWKGQTPPFLNEMYVATARSGMDRWSVQSAMALFSPRDATYRWAAENDSVSIVPGRSTTVPPERASFHFEDVMSVESMPMRTDSVRTMGGRGLTGAAAVPVVNVRFSAAGVDVTASNPGGLAWEDCFFKLNRLVVPVGDLAAGGRVERRNLTGGAGGDETTYSSRTVRGEEDDLRNRFRNIFFPDAVMALQQQVAGTMLGAGKFRTRWEGAALFGWSRREMMPVGSLEPVTMRRAVGLWAVEPEMKFDGPEILLPRGSLAMRLKSRSLVTVERGEGKFVGNRPQVIVVEFAVPDGFPNIEVNEATIHLAFRGEGFQAAVRVAPATGVSWEEENQRKFQELAGTTAFVVADPGRFYNPATRSFCVAVEVAQAATATDAGLVAGLRLWQVRDFDMTVKGVWR